MATAYRLKSPNPRKRYFAPLESANSAAELAPLGWVGGGAALMLAVPELELVFVLLESMPAEGHGRGEPAEPAWWELHAAHTHEHEYGNAGKGAESWLQLSSGELTAHAVAECVAEHCQRRAAELAKS